ncbi:MAG: hypothetical protein Q4D02_03235 [Clostridia bacterium]|nr:hypothetical protein [Clostridia bacterium]
MNIFSEDLSRNSEQFTLLITEINQFLDLNIKIQTEYKNLLLNYIEKMLDVPVENSEIDSKETNSVLELLNKLKENLAIINQNLQKLENLENDISLNQVKDIEKLFLDYKQLQKEILKNNIQINKFLLEIVQFINFIFINNTNAYKITNLENINQIIPEETVQNIKMDFKEVIENPIQSSKKDENTNSNHIENILIISEMKGKVFLPYTIENLNSILEKNKSKYTDINDVIEKEFTVPYSSFKNPILSRFKEAYKLVRNKEHKSIKEAFDLGMELLLNYNLHPAIIAACKNIDELDIYLDYLEENEIEKFDCFQIKFEIAPALQKNKY